MVSTTYWSNKSYSNKYHTVYECDLLTELNILFSQKPKNSHFDTNITNIV